MPILHTAHQQLGRMTMREIQESGVDVRELLKLYRILSKVIPKAVSQC